MIVDVFTDGLFALFCRRKWVFGITQPLNLVISPSKSHSIAPSFWS